MYCIVKVQDIVQDLKDKHHLQNSSYRDDTAMVHWWNLSAKKDWKCHKIKEFIFLSKSYLKALFCLELHNYWRNVNFSGALWYGKRGCSTNLSKHLSISLEASVPSTNCNVPYSVVAFLFPQHCKLSYNKLYLHSAKFKDNENKTWISKNKRLFSVYCNMLLLHTIQRFSSWGNWQSFLTSAVFCEMILSWAMICGLNINMKNNVLSCKNYLNCHWNWEKINRTSSQFSLMRWWSVLRCI